MKSQYSSLIMFLIIFLVTCLVTIPVANAGCDNVKPGEPALISAIPGDSSVTLNWTEPPANVTYYLLQYGLSKDSMQWGIPNIGGQGTTSFTVNNLENGKRYYFQVRAGNGCEPGSFSNTLSAEVGTPQQKVFKTPDLSIHKSVLGESTAEALIVTPTPVKPVAAVEPVKTCTFFCNSTLLLAGEIVALILFFLLVHLFSSVKPIFSFVIPLLVIVIYTQSAIRCSINDFICQYFIPLAITIYVVLLIPQKYILLSKHSEISKSTAN